MTCEAPGLCRGRGMRESHSDIDAQEARLDSRLRGNDGVTQNLCPGLDPGPRLAKRDVEGRA